MLVRMIESPKANEKTKVTRMRCYIQKDPTKIGWVTVAGNKGTVFLERAQRFQVTLQDVPLSREPELDSEAVRQLVKGELIEVLEWDFPDITPMNRLKCRATTDDAIGWVSLATNKGAPFFEACDFKIDCHSLKVY